MRTTHLAVLLPLALFAAACASTQGESYFSKSYDIARVQHIAIVDGNNPTFKPETRQILLDSVQFEFFKRGWSVIERANIQKAVDELKFQNADLTSPDNRRKLGSVLNVEALAVINIGTQDDLIVVSAKMLDVESGELIWMGTGQGELNRGMSTVAGSVAGAVAGAVIGNQIGGHGSGGAVIGGVLGGASGNLMTPSQLENAREVVTAVCESIPQR